MDGFERKLREAIEPIRESFEYIVLDCPPSLGPLTVSALVAADRVIVPVQTGVFRVGGACRPAGDVGVSCSVSSTRA